MYPASRRAERREKIHKSSLIFSRGSVLHGAGWRPTIPALLDIEVKEVKAQAQEEKLRCNLLQAI